MIPFPVHFQNTYRLDVVHVLGVDVVRLLFCRVLFFCMAREERRSKGEKGGQRRKKKRAASRVFLHFQCPIRRPNPLSLLREAPPGACSRREASESGEAAAGFCAESPAQRRERAERGRASRLSIRFCLGDHRRRTKGTRCPNSLRNFRVHFRPRPRREVAALRRLSRERQRSCPS